jgi:peptidyl-dipeptidase Dcp
MGLGILFEKLKNSKYSYNEEEVKPYFQLEKVIDGVFCYRTNFMA